MGNPSVQPVGAESEASRKGDLGRNFSSLQTATVATESDSGGGPIKPAGTSKDAAEPRTKEDPWGMVFVSGVVAGAVMAVSRAHLSGLMWLLPTGLVYALTITNVVFRFNWIHKFVATAMMFFIGMYWPEILYWFFPKKL